MKIVGAHPLRLWCDSAQFLQERRQGASNLAGYLNRNEQAHPDSFSLRKQIPQKLGL
jgi:hypothetical protein